MSKLDELKRLAITEPDAKLRKQYQEELKKEVGAGKKSHACDGGHDDAAEVRRLDIGGGGAVIVCRRHYNQEMAMRREKNKKLSASEKWDLPKWEDLKIVYEE